MNAQLARRSIGLCGYMTTSPGILLLPCAFGEWYTHLTVTVANAARGLRIILAQVIKHSQDSIMLVRSMQHA